MNPTPILSVLGEFDAHISLRWQKSEIRDALELRAALYGADSSGMVLRGGENLYAVSQIPSIRIASVRGKGPLIDLANYATENAAKAIIELFVVRRVAPRLDFALFALDHDSSHGLEVKAGVQQLWLAEPGVQEAYRQKTKALLEWTECKP